MVGIKNLLMQKRSEFAPGIRGDKRLFGVDEKSVYRK